MRLIEEEVVYGPELKVILTGNEVLYGPDRKLILTEEFVISTKVKTTAY